MRRLFLFVILFAGLAAAQRDNTYYVKEFDGTTVAAKVTNAQLACNANTAIPCVIVFDPTLTSFTTGTLPAKCTQCTWLDYRVAGSIFGSATGQQALIPDGTTALPGLAFASTPALGFSRYGGAFALGNGTKDFIFGNSASGDMALVSTGGASWSSSTTDASVAADSAIKRDAAGILAQRLGALGGGGTAQKFRIYNCYTSAADNNYMEYSALAIANGSAGTGTCSAFSGITIPAATSPKYSTSTNCSSSAAPAVCAAAAAGSVVIAAAATTVTVNTTAVTANSQIIVEEDSSLGTKLSVTCNTTTGRIYTITARTAATSFVVTSTAAPAVNPACLSYYIVN